MSTSTLQSVAFLVGSGSATTIILFVVIALAFVGVCVLLLVPTRRQRHARTTRATGRSAADGSSAGAWSFDGGGSDSGSDGGSGGSGGDGGGGGGCD